MSSFAELRAKQEAIPKPEATPIQVVFGGEMVDLNVRPLEPTVWADIKSRHLPREGSPIDRRYGYNLDASAIEAMPVCAVQVDDGKETKWSKDDWAFFFENLSSPDLSIISSVVWALNQYNPDQLREQLKDALKKASTANSKAAQNSLENSALASEGSTGGNRAQRRATSTPKGTSPAGQKRPSSRSGTTNKSPTS